MLTFIQDEILGMKWLDRLIGDLLTLCGLDVNKKLGASIRFFLYDTIKIMVLLGVLILIISYIRSYFRRREAKNCSAGSTDPPRGSSPLCSAP